MPFPGQPDPAAAPQGPVPPSLLGGAAGGSLLQMLLAFLAGSGLQSTVQNVNKIFSLGGKGKGAGGAGQPPADPNRAHRGGVRMEASQQPGQTIAPQLLQRAQQDPKLMQMLMMLLMKGQGGGGGMPPQGPPAA